MVENILIVESECEIIRPIFNKRKYYRLFEPSQFSGNTYDENILNDISLKKIENQKYFDNKNITNKPSKYKNQSFSKSQKSKKDYFTYEILRILNQPINNIHSMNRYILEKDKSEIYSSEENNNIELVPINQLEEKKHYNLDYSFLKNNIPNLTSKYH